MSHEMVIYHNDLNKIALKNFNSVDFNILMALCNRLKDRSDEVITLSFNEIKDLAKYEGKSNKRLADDIRKTNKKLLELNVMLSEEDDPGETVQFALFNKFKTSEKNKTLEVSVNKDFAYILNAISNNFTQFELEEFVTLKSSYSKACYRQLKKYRDTGWWQVDLPEFRRLLDIPDSYNFSKIGVKVLKPIEDELPEYFAGLTIEKKFGAGKGKPVVGLKFSFKKESRAKGQFNEEESGFHCPACGETLIEKVINGNVCWCHQDGWREDAKCKKIFTSVAEIKGIKETPEEKSEIGPKKEENKEYVEMPDEIREKLNKIF